MIRLLLSAAPPPVTSQWVYVLGHRYTLTVH